MGETGEWRGGSSFGDALVMIVGSYLYLEHGLFVVTRFGMMYFIVCSILKTEQHVYVTISLSIVLLPVRGIVRKIFIMRLILMRYRQCLTL